MTKPGRLTGEAPSEKVAAYLVKGAAQRTGLAIAESATLTGLNAPEPNKVVVQCAPTGQFAMRFTRESTSCGLPGTEMQAGFGNWIAAEILF